MKEENIREYCLNCKGKTCSVNGCPLNNDIPAFIHEEDYKKAFEILCETTVLPAICGRICPHEKQCQGSCIRGIKGEPVAIGEMEAFIGDNSIKENWEIRKFDLDEVNCTPNITEQQYNALSTKKVAVIGGGPAGLTCAAFLARSGVKVTIYEKHDRLGGLLAHGIPEFRLEKSTVEATINKIIDLGIKVELNKELGKNIKLEELQEKYDAIFISIGANIPTKMGINGEDLKGVYGGNTLLENNNHPSYIGKKIAVIGGGNVAMDSARTIKRLGAEKVYIIYRRAEEQMPAEKKEIEAAKNEGIEFLFQTNIVRILEKEANLNDSNNQEYDNRRSELTSKLNNLNEQILYEKQEKNNGMREVGKIECIRTQLVKKEGETRLSPVNIEDSNYLMNIDYVVMATGSKPEDAIIREFEKNKWGYIQIDENMQTSIPKIFAGGDIVGEKATVAWAARSGRNAANSILKFLIDKM